MGNGTEISVPAPCPETIRNRALEIRRAKRHLVA